MQKATGEKKTDFLWRRDNSAVARCWGGARQCHSLPGWKGKVSLGSCIRACVPQVESRGNSQAETKNRWRIKNSLERGLRVKPDQIWNIRIGLPPSLHLKILLRISTSLTEGFPCEVPWLYAHAFSALIILVNRWGSWGSKEIQCLLQVLTDFNSGLPTPGHTVTITVWHQQDCLPTQVPKEMNKINRFCIDGLGPQSWAPTPRTQPSQALRPKHTTPLTGAATNTRTHGRDRPLKEKRPSLRVILQ